MPPKRARAEERYLARFQREMELSQKVSHPHIAQTHEAGVSQGVYFIAMEYIPGQSLYRLVTSQGPLTVPRAASLFAEVASALQHAHDLGLIHRDLKPSNIMVTPNDHAKILDLGLAMMEGEVGEDIEIIGGRGYVVGSVDYMAPEQTLDATNVDSRSDLYALGCVLYFALTGKPPFPAGKTMDKINAHRRQEPDPIQWRNQEIPDSFAAIVHKLMAKNPAERYPGAARSAPSFWLIVRRKVFVRWKRKATKFSRRRRGHWKRRRCRRRYLKRNHRPSPSHCRSWKESRSRNRSCRRSFTGENRETTFGSPCWA